MVGSESFFHWKKSCQQKIDFLAEPSDFIFLTTMTENIFHPVPFSFVPRICWVFLKNHLFVRKMVIFWVIFSRQQSEKNLDGGVFLNFCPAKNFEEKTLSDGKK